MSQFTEVLESASVVAWHSGLPAGAVIGSDRAWALLGLSRDTRNSYRRFLAAVHPDDRAHLSQTVRQAWADDAEHEVEFRSIWPDGSVHWIAAKGRAQHDGEGRLQSVVGVGFDVTTNKTAEGARHDTESTFVAHRAELEQAIEYAPALIAVLDRDMRYLAVSRRWISEFRLEDRQPVVGRSHYEMFPELPARWKDVHRRCLAGALEHAEDDSFMRPDGSVECLHWEVLPWRDARGEVGGMVMVVERTTERKRAERELRVSQERLALATTGAALGSWHRNLRTGELIWSELTYSMLGIPSGSSMTFEKFIAALHHEDRARAQDTIERAIREHRDFEVEYRVCSSDGTQRWLADRGRAFYDDEGQPRRVEGIVFDITVRKQVEQALRESEARFRNLAEAVPSLVFQDDPNGNIIYANGRWSDYFGRSSLERFRWSEVIHPDDLERVNAAWSDMTRGEYTFEPFRMRRYDGSYHWFVCRTVPVRDAEGNLLHVVGTSTDIDQEKQTEDALRESRVLLDTALRAAGMGTWVFEFHENRVQAGEALTQLIGVTPQAAWAGGMEAILPRIHAEDREAVLLALERARDQELDLELECRLLRPDGSIVWVAAKGRVERAAQGRAHRLFGACVDITRRKQLEDELRQSQKMEAIGQLAGGVAHDFNNLLTIILGHASVVELWRDLPPGVREAVHEITSAGERAASLTSQLLAFGRRQVMQLRRVELNETVANVSTMLGRSLGGNVEIQLELGEPHLLVRADPNMLTQVLLNLALNARDAMPSGGRLTIRTSFEQVDESAHLHMSEAVAGTWACLSVSDTGAGIPRDLQPHIFEPFFTTKDVGKGTGLGLATVYGIVKQHRGWVAVDSAPGQGTRVKAFLPLAEHEHELPTPRAVRGEVQHGRGELILLVEDERGVRSVIKNVLEQHGYRLVVANDGREALQAFRSHAQDIDLLLTDVVMPGGLTGLDLVSEFQAQKPSLRAVLCSGYSAEAVGGALTSLPHVSFLPKPYRSEQLLSLIRSVLDVA